MSDQVVDQELEELEPQTTPVEYTITYAGKTKTYTQKTLSWKRKLQLGKLLARTVKRMDEGDGANPIGQLLADDSSDDQQAAESFTKIITDLVLEADDFFSDFLALLWNVPAIERTWFDEATDNDDDLDGVKIIEIFLDQNWDDLTDFFQSDLPRLWKRVQTKMSTEDQEDE